MKGQPVKAVIRIDPPASRWIRQQNPPGLKQTVPLENDRIELHFDMEGRRELMWWTLQWGRYAEVISPPDFRDEVRREVEAALLKYQDSS